MQWKYLKLNIYFAQVNIVKLSNEEAIIYGPKYLKVGQVKFVEDSLKKIRNDVTCFLFLSKPYHFNVFKGCFPQILLGPSGVFYCHRFLQFSKHLWKVFCWLQLVQEQLRPWLVYLFDIAAYYENHGVECGCDAHYYESDRIGKNIAGCSSVWIYIMQTPLEWEANV